MRQVALIAMLAAVAGGCTTSGSEFARKAQAQLAAAPVCCKSLRDAKVTPLPVKPTDLELSATSQTFNFDGGKAFFELFELPHYTAPYSILIGAQMTGSALDMSVMAFRVSFLDANFEPTRNFDEDTLRKRGSVLERTVFVNPGNQAERYMVIYGSRKERQSDSTIGVVGSTPIIVGGGMFMMPTGSEMKSSLYYSPVGKYSIRVEGLQQTAQH